MIYRGALHYHNVNQSMAAQISNMSAQISNLKADRAELQDNVTELNKKLQDILPYSKVNGQLIQLVNQPNTHNPTWNELKVFLTQDNPDRLQYMERVITCEDFVKRLHDKAELAGIRAGVVVVEFYNNEPHAINCFYTTDKDIIYIDAWNAVAYFEIGKSYGLIAINCVDHYNIDFSYASYEKWELPDNSYNASLYFCPSYAYPGTVKSFEIYW